MLSFPTEVEAKEEFEKFADTFKALGAARSGGRNALLMCPRRENRLLIAKHIPLVFVAADPLVTAACLSSTSIPWGAKPL